MICENTKLSYFGSNNSTYVVSVKVLIVIWFFTFPVQGALYQLSIYLIPLLGFINPEFRQEFLKQIYRNRILIGCLIIPVLISFFINVLLSVHEYQWGSIPLDAVTRIFWRLVLFSISISIFFIIFKQKIDFYIYCFIGSAFVHSVLAFYYSSYQVSKFFLFEPTGRAEGLIGSPNEFGLLMCLGVIVCLGFLLEIIKDRDIYKKITLVVFVIIFLFFLLLSQSRGAWLSFFMSIPFFFMFGLSKKVEINRKVFACMLLIMVLFLMAFFLMDDESQRLTRLFDDNIRILIWKYFSSVWKDNWLFGVYDLKQYNFLYDVNGKIYRNPHSVYLDIAVRCGVLGLLGFMIFLFCCLKSFMKSRLAQVFLPFATAVIVGTAFSFSIYGKVFAQSLYSIMFIFFLFCTIESKNKAISSL